jgi:hypothetical protein
MDPITALGLAANVVQFLTFAGGIISKSAEIYSSADGQLVEQQELRIVANNLQALAIALPKSKGSRHHGNPNSSEVLSDQQLGELCKECRGVSHELLGALSALQVNGKHKRWNSFRQALNSVWSEDKINALELRVNRYRSQIDTALLFSLRYVS